jgi:hypothetical protein
LTREVIDLRKAEDAKLPVAADPPARQYWRFVQKWAWLLALGLTVFGTALLAPTAEQPRRLVVLAPIAYLLFFAMFRLTVRHAKRIGLATPTSPSESRREPAADTSHAADFGRTLRKTRLTIFGWGIGLILAVLIAGWSALWIQGVPGHLESTIVMWVVFALWLAGSIAYWLAAARDRSLATQSEHTPEGGESVVAHLARLSWGAVARATGAFAVGVVFALLSGQAWRALPFAILSVGILAAIWFRLAGPISGVDGNRP